MKEPSPVLVQHLFPELLDSLLALLADLSQAEWEQPTVAAGWSVKDIALHLLGDEIFALASRRDHFRPPSRPFASWAERVAYLNQFNNGWVVASRRMSTRLLCDLLRWTGDQVSEYFASLDPFEIGGAVSWAGPEPAPMWLDVAREYTERWHHQQHIREALGRPGLVEPRYLAPVLATFVHALPHTYQAVEAADGTDILLMIQGDSGGEWTVRRELGKWRLYNGRPEKSAAAEVVLPQDVAWRLFTKGISKDGAQVHAIMRGEQDLAMQMLNAIAIIA